MPTDDPDLSRLQELSPEVTAQYARDLFEAELEALERDQALLRVADAEKLTAKQREEIEDLRQDRGQRKLFSLLIFGLISLWLTAVLIIVSFDGASAETFNLSKTVLTTLIGSTTGSVLGLFLVVARYLFPKR